MQNQWHSTKEIFLEGHIQSYRFPGSSVVKNLPVSVRHRRCGFQPWVGKIPWRKKSQPTSVSVLAWRTPWTGEPGRLQSIGSGRFTRDWAAKHSIWKQCFSRHKMGKLENCSGQRAEQRPRRQSFSAAQWAGGGASDPVRQVVQSCPFSDYGKRKVTSRYTSRYTGNMWPKNRNLP